jgi:glycosyltransferase involved in cell wall biosynthesis
MLNQARRPSFTAFFPCYNDAETIGSVVAAADATLRGLSDDYEIIVVNDGSRDRSAEVLAELQRTMPRLRVITHELNRGYGGALRSGFASATKELVFYTDGDGQYDPAELARLYEQLGPDVDVVQGWKMERHDGWHRKLIGRLYHNVVHTMFNLHVRDVDCDFRLIRRHVLESFPLTSDTGCITVELVTRIEQAGFRIHEMPVHHYPRLHGHSQFFNFRAVSSTLCQLSALWWRLCLGFELTERYAPAVPRLVD